MPRIVALLSLLASAASHRHGGRHGGRGGKCANALEYARRFTPLVNDTFEADCAADDTPRGYYGAFFEPCTFSFLVVDDAADTDCSTGTVIGDPVPIIWPNNQTLPRGPSSDDKDSGDSMDTSEDSGLRRRRLDHHGRGGDSSDDYSMMGSTTSMALSADDLALWPDQCVGAMARCYPIAMFNSTLFRLFGNQAGWPSSATHVRVDCQADAAEYSLVSSGMAADESEALAAVSSSNSQRKMVKTIIALVISAVAVACLCCLCKACRRHRHRRHRHRRGMKHTDAEATIVTDPTTVAKAIVVDDDMDKTVDGSVDAENECQDRTM